MHWEDFCLDDLDELNIVILIEIYSSKSHPKESHVQVDNCTSIVLNQTKRIHG